MRRAAKPPRFDGLMKYGSTLFRMPKAIARHVMPDMPSYVVVCYQQLKNPHVSHQAQDQHVALGQNSPAHLAQTTEKIGKGSTLGLLIYLIYSFDKAWC